MRTRRSALRFTARMAFVLLVAMAVAGAIAERKMRSVARTVAQAVADAAALAGASGFLDARDAEDLVRAYATEYVELNARVQSIRVRPEEIAVDPEEGTVRVRVEARAYGLPVWVAWIVGVHEVMESAEATAEAARVWCEDAGTSPEGFPMERCEGMVKALRLIR